MLKLKEIALFVEKKLICSLFVYLYPIFGKQIICQLKTNYTIFCL